jgi:hypothetical protein
MDWILGSCLRFGRLVAAVAIGLVVVGIAQLRSAPVFTHLLLLMVLSSAAASTQTTILPTARTIAAAHRRPDG